MAETSNIQAMANKVSNDIFKWFKWEDRPLRDVNWKCVCQIKHGSERLPKITHPSDIVFHYPDPYTGKTIYVNTDLKSYSKDSISKQSIVKALKSLAMSVECADISSDWQKKFLLDNLPSSEIIGLLFIYNNDNDYDKNFESLLEKIDVKKLGISEKKRVAIIGPKKIVYLINIVNDIKNLIAEEMMPPKDDYTFYYPDLNLAKVHGNEWSQSASIETLNSSWIIIKHRKTPKIDEGYVIYYQRDGSKTDEFIYLLDALSHYQILISDYEIRIRLIDAVDEAVINFDNAKKSYLEHWAIDDSRKMKLDRIEVSSITNVVRTYNELEIGMELR